MIHENITTLAQLKKSGYQTKSIKQELRDNLINSLKKKKPTFQGIIGYDTTVIPDVENIPTLLPGKAWRLNGEPVTTA